MNTIQFHALCSAVYLATINCFAVLWVGLYNKIVILSMRRKQLLIVKFSHLPSQETVSFFVPEIILWRLAPMLLTNQKRVIQ